MEKWTVWTFLASLHKNEQPEKSNASSHSCHWHRGREHLTFTGYKTGSVTNTDTAHHHMDHIALWF